jgi:S1-C subfamily serine protease
VRRLGALLLQLLSQFVPNLFQAERLGGIMFKRFLLALWILILIPVCSHADPTFKSAMVKIYTVSSFPDYATPWNKEGPQSFSGSGVVIEGDRILTNAHVVSYETFLQVRSHGQAKKYDAYVLAVSHEADLAVLGVKDAAFFEGIAPIEIGGLPELQEPVVVCGFPTGGDTMSMTTGIVSRIENQTYIHSFMDMLAIQVDAAINPGNSGGPALSDDGLIVGVAMQTQEQADNISYLIPTPVIQHFLLDIDDGNFDGVPELGIYCQPTENNALQEKLGMSPEMTGVLVNRVAPETAADGVLNEGDVILKIDEFDIASDGTIEFRPQERTMFNYAAQRKQIGELISLEILREGKIKSVPMTLEHKIGTHRLVKIENDKQPTYYIYGGMVFNPLTINYLECWGDNWWNDAPKTLLSHLQQNWKKPKLQEIVVLNRVLPIEENVGYHDINDVQVVSINGKIIERMKDVVEILKHNSSEYVDIMTAKGSHIILKSKDGLKAKDSIKTVYDIKSDISGDLL